MPGQIKTLFVSLGELKPDLKLYSNDGLVTATSVVPVFNGYIAMQKWAESGDEPPDEPYGLHTHFAGGSTYYAYMGTLTTLQEYSTAFVRTDKTRAVGGPYTTGGAGGEAGWMGASFGDAVILTNYTDDPQLLTSPAAANFAKLAQSGAGNPGFDPKAKFVFPLRDNLFLANLNLSGAFDTLASGANPTTVAWSQSGNVRQFGSFSVTPELTGTGYQSLNYDIGHITGGVGGMEYGLVAFQAGFARIDGPPYIFRPIVHGTGCRYPKSIVRMDRDIYLWGPSGPSVLRNGEGPLIVLGRGRVARTLVDNATGFSSQALYPGIAIRHLTSAVDVLNGLVFWSFTPAVPLGSGNTGSLSIIYNVSEDRFSFTENEPRVVGDLGPFAPGIIFLQSRPDLNDSWAPCRDFIGIMKYQDFALNLHYKLAIPSYSAAGTASPRLERAFQQLETDYTTRVRRVRPIFSVTDSSAFTVTVTVKSKNKPWETPTEGAFTTQDSHSWIPTTTSKFADFHQIGLQFTSTLPTIAEIEGYEIEYETGGRYSA